MEKLIAHLDIPASLKRERLEKTHGGHGTAPQYRLTLLPRPHGYPASGGNVVVAELRRSTGRAVTIRVGRGWTYEEPNIRVSEGEALDTVVRAAGGNEADWTARLEYTTSPDPSGPQDLYRMNQAKTMRLCYRCSSSTAAACVDSVTGEAFGVRSIGGGSPSSSPVSKPASKSTKQGNHGEVAVTSYLPIYATVGLGPQGQSSGYYSVAASRSGIAGSPHHVCCRRHSAPCIVERLTHRPPPGLGVRSQPARK